MVARSRTSPRRAGRLASRRLKALAALLPAASASGDAVEVCEKAAALLGLDSELFPFVLIYLFEPNHQPRVVASAGLKDARSFGASDWPLAEAVENRVPVLVRDAPALPAGARDAVAVPIAGRSAEQAAIGVLVAGVDERFAEDPDHPTFIQLVAGQLASALAGIGWAEESAELRAQMARTLELEQLKSEFLRLASHELRGPLAVIRGYLDMIDGGTFGTVPAGIESVLPTVVAKIEEMNRLVEQMLETARLEENRLTLTRQTLDLRQLARESANALAPLAAQQHKFDFRLPPDPVVVRADRTRIAGVITNVIDNAIKYSPEGGRITVECRADRGKGMAEVAVADEGLGIAEGDLPRLFKRFGRIVTSENSHISGTGLGLYLAREITRMHGGDISLESVPGAGTRVIISLPVEVGAGGQPASEAAVRSS